MTMMGMMRCTVTMGMWPEIRWLEKARHEGFGWMQRHDRKNSLKLVNKQIWSEMEKRENIYLEMKKNLSRIFMNKQNCHDIFNISSAHDHNNETKSTHTKKIPFHSQFKQHRKIPSLNLWIPFWHEKSTHKNILPCLLLLSSRVKDMWNIQQMLIVWTRLLAAKKSYDIIWGLSS